MPLALLILQGIVQALPLAESITNTLRRNADGSVTWVTEITQAGASFDADLKQAADWNAAHPKAQG